MPNAAPKPCTYPGCGALAIVSSPRCEAHTKQARAQDYQRRGSSSSRGYTYKWQQARAAYLLANPLCQAHAKQSMVVPASVVDHIDPHKGDMSKFWDQGNWQPLCKACHDYKTATEDGGFGNANRTTVV